MMKSDNMFRCHPKCIGTQPHLTEDVHAHYISTAMLQFCFVEKSNDTFKHQITTPNHQCLLLYYNTLVVIKKVAHVIKAMDYCAVEHQIGAKQEYIYLGAISHVLSNNVLCYVYDCKINTIVRMAPNTVHQFNTVYVMLFTIIYFPPPLFQIRACRIDNNAKMDPAIIKVMEDKLSAVLTQWDNEAGKIPPKDACKGLFSQTGQGRGGCTDKPATNYYWKHPLRQVW